MLPHARPLLGIAALAALAACSPDNAPSAITSPGTTLNSQGIGQQMRFAHAKVCPSAAPAEARCHSLVRVDNVGTPMATRGPTGYNPAALIAAYNLWRGGGGQVCALAD